MWTCGIDIATQQLRPAMTSTVCSAAGDMPSGRDGCDEARGAQEATGASRGDRRRSARVSGSMVATQKMAMPRYVRRQPTLWMKCCTTGGQTVPAR